jgi:TonB-dependent starch-binding outer membrane protein SusC
MWRNGLIGVIATVFASGSALAQSGTITGTVTSADAGMTITAAHVVVVGTSIGADTRDDGRYTIVVPPGTYTVRASRIGFAPDSVTGVSVAAGGSASVNFQLKPTANQLASVVVVGYGEEKARDITGSVATVTTKDFNPGRIVSPQQLIQAKVPGVQVVGANEPGGSVAIRIRGGSSVTSSNEPLFVVDGLPLAIGGGISAGRDPLNFLNPNDIESITVLKDASATAIYGSRGSNGVIIVTTKSGKQGTRLTYTGSVSHSSAVGGPNLMNAAQFSAAVAQFAPTNVALFGNANTNWLDAIEQSATGVEHSVAIAGNRDDMHYRLSVGYLNQTGVLQGSTVKRASTGVSYNDELFSNRLDVQANIKGARSDDWFTPNGVLGSAVAFAPTQPIRTASGAYTEYANALAPGNPLSSLSLITDQGTTYRGLGNIQTTYKMPVLEGLSATMNAGYDLAKSDHTTFTPSNDRSQIVNATGGTFFRQSPSQVNTVFDLYGTYAPPLDQLSSHVDLTAGYSYERARGDFPSFIAQGLSSNLLGPNGIPAATLQNNFLTQDESRLASFFGRVNYSLKDRYLVAMSVRRDGSSRFGPTNQWGVFPSIGFGWRVVDESFMRRFTPISDLKLRASYGVNGNQAFANYQAFSAYTIGGSQAQAQFGNQFITTIRPSAADPNIKWEQTTSNDLGLDYGLFNNRITGTVDYYFKKTKDLIFNVPIAAGTNLSNFLTTNIGSLQNRGLEFGVNGRVFDGSRGLTWDASFTASTNANKLLRINAVGAGNEQILTGGIAGGVGTDIEVLQPGFPINSFLVYRHKTGPDGRPVTGDLPDIQLYQDINGDGIINQSDRVPYKNPAPKWVFAHTSQFAYRNLDLNFTLRANRGNYVYNNVASNLGHYTNVQGPAPINLDLSVLKYGFLNPQYFSDLYVEDASFLKMDNISLGYTFHNMSSLGQVRIIGTIQNVFTITNYTGVDPEAGINGIDNTIYPRSRTFSFGTNIGF